MYRNGINKTIVLSLTIILTLLLKGVVYGGGIKKVLTLKQAIDIAIKKNHLIKEATETERVATDEYLSTKADLFPKVSANYSYTRLKYDPFVVFGPAKVPVGERDNYHWDITITQPLFTGLALTTKKRMALTGIDLNRAERERTIMDVVKQVKIAYYRILMARKFLLVADEAVEQLKAHLKDAESLFKQGMIPQNDLLRSKVALADAKQKRESARSNLDMAISSFNTLLSMDINEETDVEDVLSVHPISPDLNRLIDEAITHRPEIRSLRLALKNADYAIRLAKALYYPEVSLVGRYEQNGDNPTATNNEFTNDHNASITLQLRWSIFEWGKKKAEADRAVHEKSSLTYRLRQAEDDIRLEVKDAFLNLNVARQNIKTAEESLSQAKENYRITDLQYKNQIATSTDVIDARTMLTQAETNYYSALYSYLISIAELERATGMELYNRVTQFKETGYE